MSKFSVSSSLLTLVAPPTSIKSYYVLNHSFMPTKCRGHSVDCFYCSERPPKIRTEGSHDSRNIYCQKLGLNLPSHGYETSELTAVRYHYSDC